MPPTDAGWDFPSPATPKGSAAYYSIRFAAADRRDDLAALHGWRYQVQGILDRVTDPGVALAKLAWWRDELGRAFDARPTHPLTHRLAPQIKRLGLPREPFLDLAGTVETTLARRWPGNREELAADAGRDLGALFELLARTEGDRDPERIARARRLGAYATLVYGIRDSGWSLRQGRLGLFPADLLADLGTDHADLAQPAGRQRLPQALAAIADQARALRGGVGETVRLPLTLRIRVCLVDRLLAEVAACGYAVADRRIGLTPIRKLWHAWRESKR